MMKQSGSPPLVAARSKLYRGVRQRHWGKWASAICQSLSRSKNGYPDAESSAASPPESPKCSASMEGEDESVSAGSPPSPTMVPPVPEMAKLDFTETSWDEMEAFHLRKYRSWEIDWDSIEGYGHRRREEGGGAQQGAAIGVHLELDCTVPASLGRRAAHTALRGRPVPSSSAAGIRRGQG